MNKKYSIGLFAGAIVLVVTLLSVAYQVSYDHANRQLVKQQEESLPEEEISQSINTDGTATKEEGYYLTELNGYVVVYLSDKTTPYEYTNIMVSMLPEDIKDAIIAGKVIESTKELYGFLENYSS